MSELAYDWKVYRGATPDLWPRLAGCTGCGYTYWSFGEEMDPEGDNHCSNGKWVFDGEALGMIQ